MATLKDTSALASLNEQDYLNKLYEDKNQKQNHTLTEGYNAVTGSLEGAQDSIQQQTAQKRNEQTAHSGTSLLGIILYLIYYHVKAEIARKIIFPPVSFKFQFIELLVRGVIANQSADWCGNPLTFRTTFRHISLLTGGFPRQCEHWLGMT